MSTDQFALSNEHLRRDRWLILCLALSVRIAAAVPQAQPNYMDAAYYTVGGQRLVQGFGFNDPYVWNYLDQPIGLPQPSHLYWMPLPSILVGISQSIFGINYRAAQIPFILLSALLPLVAFSVAWRITRSRRAAWLAALLTIFSGFYLPYWGVPESFAPYAVFGSLALYLAADRSARRLFLAGVCAGLAHLSRADGVMLLLPMVWIQLGEAPSGSPKLRVGYEQGGGLKPETSDRKFSPRLSALGLIIVGYLLIMSPWFLRNVTTIGAPLSSAGTELPMFATTMNCFHIVWRLTSII